MKRASLTTVTCWARVSACLTAILTSLLNLPTRWEPPTQPQRRLLTSGCLERL